VDSYGPVTDNAQSVYELSLIEQVPNIRAEMKKDFGFDPNFARAKENLEENDGREHVKATAKPVLIGTAVVGATTMIFSIIVALTAGCSRAAVEPVDSAPAVPAGLITGGAVIYWLPAPRRRRHDRRVPRGRVHQGEYPARGTTRASVADSKRVVAICTQYGKKGCSTSS